MLRLVVGLGNPGPRYKDTRHNVGFRLVERMASPESSWRNCEQLGRYCEREAMILAEPLTFMNESGRFVSALARRRGIKSSEILICLDDLALPLGDLRLRPGGSSGGHKGLDSIIEHFKTPDIARLRIGIGPRPEWEEGADFVLNRFSASEKNTLEDILESASQAVHVAVAKGLEAAMNRFNKRHEPLS